MYQLKNTGSKIDYIEKRVCAASVHGERYVLRQVEQNRSLFLNELFMKQLKFKTKRCSYMKYLEGQDMVNFMIVECSLTPEEMKRVSKKILEFLKLKHQASVVNTWRINEEKVIAHKQT